MTVGDWSTLSVAVAMKVTTAPPGPVASAVMLPGTFTVGGVVSCTVTVNEPEAWLPESSVAVQLTVVVPMGKTLPDGGKHETLTFVSTRSLAEAEKVTTAPEGPVAGVVMLPGTVMLGGVVSWIVTEKRVRAGVAMSVRRGAVDTRCSEAEGTSRRRRAVRGDRAVDDVRRGGGEGTERPPGPVASAVMSPGTLMFGRGRVLHGDAEVVGEDRRVKEGVAVHVTVVVLMENVVPEGGGSRRSTCHRLLSDSST